MSPLEPFHHYDKIGLLKAALIKDNGYPYYDDENLQRLQEIFLIRELDFPLKAIDKIINHKTYDRKEGLKDHHIKLKLLELKESRINSY